MTALLFYIKNRQRAKYLECNSLKWAGLMCDLAGEEFIKTVLSFQSIKGYLKKIKHIHTSGFWAIIVTVFSFFLVKCLL